MYNGDLFSQVFIKPYVSLQVILGSTKMNKGPLSAKYILKSMNVTDNLIREYCLWLETLAADRFKSWLSYLGAVWHWPIT